MVAGPDADTILQLKNTFLHCPLSDVRDPRRTSSWPPGRRVGDCHGHFNREPEMLEPVDQSCKISSNGELRERRITACSKGRAPGVQSDHEEVRHNDWDNVRSVMMKGIPSRCTREEVLASIDEVGFAGRYEFFYLPIKRSQRQNYGFAFVGFQDPTTSLSFRAAMSGYRFHHRESSKRITLQPARLQGIDEVVAHFLHSKVAQTKWSPTFNVELPPLQCGIDAISTDRGDSTAPRGKQGSDYV